MTARCLGVVVLLLGAAVARSAEPGPLDWPKPTRAARPWVYNWWPGSAVDRENLARELRRYRDAGLGGIHVIPIYGVKGAEARDVPYLGEDWMRLLDFAIEEGDRLDLGVDMTTGSGWCFGGPWIPAERGGQAASITPKGIVAKGTGLKVKRAAPGGEGLMINPFDPEAMRLHLEPFTAAFRDAPRRPRAMYHDSYEYNTRWAPGLLEAFERRRGYRLQDHLELLGQEGASDAAARVRADLRETVSDVMVEEVMPLWVSWCRERGIATRYQAHGSPANLLDLYALADVPETEMFGRGKRDPLVSGFDPEPVEGDRDPLVSKLASSAAHVSGRKLVSSETGTWMAEHFCETLEELKCLVDLLLVSGVNHVFYHGCCYSPDDAAWPGWLFYASTEMNPRSALWHDAPALNAYVTRCQSVLQAGEADSDMLVYWPIHDLWHTAAGRKGDPFAAVNLTVHTTDWLHGQPLGKTARTLWEHGFTFDYVSDRQLQGARAEDGRVRVPGGSYRAVLVPPTAQLPLETFRALRRLADSGATVIFEGGLPSDVPGFHDLDGRRAALADLVAGFAFAPAEDPGVQVARLGSGRIVRGTLEPALKRAGLRRETLADHPRLLLIRRRHAEGHLYFLANQGPTTLDGEHALATPARSVVAMDPMTGRTGTLAVKAGSRGEPVVRLRLESGQSLILRTFTDRAVSGPAWNWTEPGEAVATISGPWEVTFTEGGPILPKSFTTPTLTSWTRNGDPETERFAGTAVYRASFDRPVGRGPWQLDLGRVCHSARIRVNGRDLGTCFMRPYQVELTDLQPHGNRLEIEVANLSANRIRDLDRRQVPWRIFRDINFVSIRYQPFDASSWPVQESGLLGPVRLRRCEVDTGGSGP